ncbi:type II toxin-antitoxin system PemK/MazF family toxin [Desulfotomaculum nigrificans]|uniref:type II toxin-antitoxin system PemK/MazF family toxin n=1 Tax=Desulfotomaculum nigrificans TaxID=1565 RepID=UPI0001FAECEB|nr:type II toxin-antitoxin system PemK/MazF family toxin [Desulfotomaculum nigrificans]
MLLFENTIGALDYLKNILTKVGDTIRKWESKRGYIFLNWLDVKLNYLQREKYYDPIKDHYYKRGQIVHVDFGFNVGGEIGGSRFAIVLWAPQKSTTVTVIPITSQKPNSKHNPYLHVNMGELLEDGIVNWAKVEQIRSVSKLRVKYPLSKYKTTKVPPELMDEIDKAIVRLYTKNRNK